MQLLCNRYTTDHAFCFLDHFNFNSIKLNSKYLLVNFLDFKKKIASWFDNFTFHFCVLFISFNLERYKIFGTLFFL